MSEKTMTLIMQAIRRTCDEGGYEYPETLREWLSAREAEVEAGSDND